MRKTIPRRQARLTAGPRRPDNRRLFRHLPRPVMHASPLPADLFDAAEHCLACAEPAAKAAATVEVARRWRAGELTLQSDGKAAPIGEPGRPARPELVAPRDLPRRGLGSAEGHAALIHAIAHIEFNAINLAWDAVYRFRDLPRAFYDDWVRVADEEAYHFGLVRDHLRELGFDYGDFPAHNGLWEMAQKTAGDALLRMALVPRVLEARGLDVTPGIMRRLAAQGDEAAVAVLAVILRDEVGHVAIGTRWFHHLCAARDLPPEETFRRLFDQYMSGRASGPLHRSARRRAGFSEDELNFLEGVG